MSWKFDISSDIRYDWGELVETSECSHVFYHPSLVRAWIETYKPLRKITPFIIHATDGDNLAVLPMTLWQRNWKNVFQRAIVPVGYSDFDYHDPIFLHKPSTDSLAEFWEGVVKAIGQQFSFDTLTTDGVTDSMIADSLQWQRGEICPLLRLDDIHTENELMTFFKTSLRGDIRRQIRRLEEIAPLKFTEYHSWEEIPSTTFNEFMRQHTMRWPNAYKAPQFHENLLKEGLRAGVIHFSTLSVGDTEIAWHLGFTFRGRYYYYMPAGNQDYFKYSPTKIHLFYLVRRAVELGYSVYDHLRGEENYKSGWSNDSQYVNTMTIGSISVSSKLKHNLLKMRQLITPPR